MWKDRIVTKRKAPEDKLPVGRPSAYNQDTANIICIRIAEGESLRSICRDDYMPSQVTVYSWLFKFPEFLKQYTHAREEQAETHADEIVDIADETPETVPVYDKEGNVIELKLDSAYIAWQKNRIEARKWTAMKLKPKKYGDKIVQPDEISPVAIQINLGVFKDVIESIKQQRQVEIIENK